MNFDYLWTEEERPVAVHTRRPTSSLYQNRDTPMGHEAFVERLRHSPDDFYGYLRMEESVYEMLLGRLTPYIQRQDTRFRMAIPPNQRLLAALRYFVTGLEMEQHRFETGISPPALKSIIYDVCLAIILEFGDEYMKVGNDNLLTAESLF